MTKVSRFVGVDPGGKGGFAVLGEHGELLRFGNAASKEENWTEGLLDALREARLQGRVVCAVERMLAFRGIPAQDLIDLGSVAGVCLGLAISAGAEVRKPTSSQWKKAVGVSKDKALTKAYTLDLYPELPKRTRQDICEAILIARWAYQTTHEELT